MDAFMIRFLLCNLLISAAAGILLALRRLLKGTLTRRMQYDLWLLLLGLMAVPFLPLPETRLLRIRSVVPSIQAGTVRSASPAFHAVDAAGWMNDIGVAVRMKAPSGIGTLLFLLWAAGIAGMLVVTTRAFLRLRVLRRSALPLQDPALCRLYQDCLQDLHIKKRIPIYSTAYLRSPVMAGLLRPGVYLPIRLISVCQPKELRYMLLHELCHYRYKDALINHLVNIAAILYWPNPFIWLALDRMRTDRETACDAAVLELLDPGEHGDYGQTLIDLAEKASCPPLSLAAGISGTMAQMQERIHNIAGYRPLTLRRRLYGCLAFALTAVLLSGFIPLLSIQAADDSRYRPDLQEGDVTYLDLSDTFEGDRASFVLYDAAADTWQIYAPKLAAERVAPVSTYKIYSALLGLESGIISPGQSRIGWNGQRYLYDGWNGDQTLATAMRDSVTWYFQTIDRKAGLAAIQRYVDQIGYGNETVGKDISTYWGDSSLKISPIEQVRMLERFYHGRLGALPENTQAVKDAIRLYDTDSGTLFGKTGTGEENGRNVL